jgi:hypothetical protein
MSEKKPTPRGTKIFAGAIFAGLAAAVVGQRLSSWTLQSQTNTVIVVVAGAVIGGLVAWFATKPKAS